MYEEQRMMAAGVPFSEAFPMCRDIHKEIAMGRLDPIEHTQEEHHSCKCGGSGNCPNCPNKKSL